MVNLNQEDLLGVNISDTFMVTTSTLILDSLPTAGKGVLLTGNINDAVLGAIKAASYFQISPTDLASVSLPEDARFDSIKLRLEYSGYYYGDTSTAQDLSVHRLTNRIEIKSVPGYLEPEESGIFSSTATFFNRSTVPFNPVSLASKRILPRPLSSDSIMLGLPESLGKELFALIKNNDTKISNTEEFLDYFNGLVIKSDGNSIIGLKDSTVVKIYYSYLSDNGLRVKKELLFGLYDANHQFNNITADRTNTLLQNLGITAKLLPSTATGNKTYIQGGIGLVTKIEFPGVAYLVGDERTSINKAELIIQSTTGQDRPYSLPRELVLMVANKNNIPQSVFTNASGASSLYLNKNDEGIAKASYSYTLTDYISNYATTYKNTSLLLSLPVSDLQNTVSRLEIGSQENANAKIKLIITYTKF